MPSAARHRRQPASPTIVFPDGLTMREQAEQEEGEPGWKRGSGDSFPRDGYSNLFQSGLRPTLLPSPFPSPSKLSSFPSPPSSRVSPRKRSPTKPPVSLSPMKTPARRRRRSSIIPTTPGTAASHVERALDDVMRGLKLVAMGREEQQQESRWSSSSDGSALSGRKSGESARSVFSRKSKSRKSEDTLRMDVDLEVVPPVPSVPPQTPGRRKRLVEGLARRLGLTPKKKGSLQAPPPPALIPNNPFDAPAPPPLMPSTPKTIPKKSSIRSLRSALTKKSSTNTLRSAHLPTHPFAASATHVPILDCQSPAPPPLPVNSRTSVEGCFPTTPKRKAKTSIGRPELQKSTSPSLFLEKMPRRAPSTPKRADDGAEMRDEDERTPRKAGEGYGYGTPQLEVDGDDSMGTVASPQLGTPIQVLGTPHVQLADTPSARALTARAEQAALKPKRLLNLLPSSQRAALGLDTPPASLRSTKKAMAVRGLAGAEETDKENKGVGPYARRPSQRARDPLGVIGTGLAFSAVGNRRDGRALTGEGDEPSKAVEVDSYFSASRPPSSATTSTPHRQSTHSTHPSEAGTFGHSTPNKHANKRGTVPDFSASPIRRVVGHSREISAISGISGVSELQTEESGVEEWELERYLRELEGREEGWAR